ncbi:MAG TPA: citrate (Si)-synthase, partial [Opitutae bacterium]|nr:citrate (Si)-synthase [Opitutae bacterium]
MPDTANLEIGDDKYSLEIITGTEQEKAIDVSRLRKQSKHVTFDDGYGNTGSCESAITFIDGDKGILRYRGYDIVELAEKSTFLESAYLLLYGVLPSRSDLEAFKQLVGGYCDLPEEVVQVVHAQPKNAHPMAVLSSGLQALGGVYPQFCTNDRKKDLEAFDQSAALIISSVRSIAAAHYRHVNGQALPKADSDRSYCGNFLSMMFAQGDGGEEVP